MLGLLLLLTPLGVLDRGVAWGEWAPDEIRTKLGFVPQGMGRTADWWRALFSGYHVTLFGTGRGSEAVGYVVCALLGSALVYLLAMAGAKLLSRTGGRV